MCYARAYVEIDHVYCGRGVYRVHLLETLEDLRIEFVNRATQTRKIQQSIQEADSDTFVTNYETAHKNPPTDRMILKFVVIDHRTYEDDHFYLVTNCEATCDPAQPLAEADSRCWGIEVSYRKS